MNNIIKHIGLILASALIVLLAVVPVFADEMPAAPEEETAVTEQIETADTAAAGTLKAKAIAAAAIVGFVAAVGAVCMCLSVRKASDGIARQPEAAGNIRSGMMLGLVFIETTIIYALIVAILIIFVL